MYTFLSFVLCGLCYNNIKRFQKVFTGNLIKGHIMSMCQYKLAKLSGLNNKIIK